MVFGQKWPFLQLLFFRQYRSGKCVLRYSRMTHAFLGFKKGSSKSRKIVIFSKRKKREPMVLVQKWPFFQLLFFQAKQGSKMSFMNYDILERKNGFLGYKNKKFKKSKSCHFCKGVNKWFLDKNGHFCSLFFSRQNRPGKCLLRYSTTKKRLSWL